MNGLQEQLNEMMPLFCSIVTTGVGVRLLMMQNLAHPRWQIWNYTCLLTKNDRIQSK